MADITTATTATTITTTATTTTIDSITNDDENEAYDVMMAKVGALLSMFVLTMIVGGVPFLLNKFFKWTTTNKDSPRTTLTIQCLLHFGGGVLLCTTFIHLLPEVEGICTQLFNCGIVRSLSFPLAETVMCAGFFLMYVIEECVHDCLRRHSKTQPSDSTPQLTAVDVKVAQAESICTRDTCAESECDLPCSDVGANQSAADLNCDCCYTVELAKQNAEVKPSTELVATPSQLAEHGHSHLPPTVDAEASVAASLRGALLVFALSIHELFEGLSIGLEDTPSSVWLTAAAISVHKLVLAFCVGMELLVSGMRPAFCLLYMFIFAVVSPVGISIGIIITASEDTVGPNLTSAILQGIACGTLVYVVFFEIISTHHLGYGTFLSVLVGFCVMFGLLQIGDDDDDDSCIITGSSTSTLQNYVLNMKR